MFRLSVVVLCSLVAWTASAADDPYGIKGAAGQAISETLCEMTGAGCGPYRRPYDRQQPRRSSGSKANTATYEPKEVLDPARRLDKCQYYERYYSEGYPAGGPTQTLQVCFSFWGSVQANMLAAGHFTVLEHHLVSGDDPWVLSERVPWLRRKPSELSCIAAIGIPRQESPRDPKAVSRITFDELVVRIECRESKYTQAFPMTQFEQRAGSNPMRAFSETVLAEIDKAFRSEAAQWERDGRKR